MAKQPEGKMKDDKSKPTKTLKEKRAAKAAKKDSKKNDQYDFVFIVSKKGDSSLFFGFQVKEKRGDRID